MGEVIEFLLENFYVKTGFLLGLLLIAVGLVAPSKIFGIQISWDGKKSTVVSFAGVVLVAVSLLSNFYNNNPSNGDKPGATKPESIPNNPPTTDRSRYPGESLNQKKNSPTYEDRSTAVPDSTFDANSRLRTNSSKSTPPYTYQDSPMRKNDSPSPEGKSGQPTSRRDPIN